ncbi:hypothetical protein GRJ2_001745900 [Grus japonensis]|uniref:Uncharacterized protein n=1 Tax=Grus japonensis TaxID=30415 RepID=A0ABC9X548_GRUJA
MCTVSQHERRRLSSLHSCHGAARQPRGAPQQALATLPAPCACHVCSSLVEVDQRRIPSHTVFSRAGGPVPHQQPGAPHGSPMTQSCVNYTLQQVTRCTLVVKERRVPQAVPRGDAFPTLLMGDSSNLAIDRSPTPTISASWMLYEEEAAGLH